MECLNIKKLYVHEDNAVNVSALWIPCEGQVGLERWVRVRDRIVRINTGQILRPTIMT